MWISVRWNIFPNFASVSSSLKVWMTFNVLGGLFVTLTTRKGLRWRPSILQCRKRIKSAQIFNATSEKKVVACTKNAQSLHAFKNNHKCKNSGKSKEDVAKKPKSGRCWSQATSLREWGNTSCASNFWGCMDAKNVHNQREKTLVRVRVTKILCIWCKSLP